MRKFGCQWLAVLSAVAAFALGASAENGFANNISLGGGNDLAWLKVNNLALGVEDDGSLNDGYLSVKYRTPVRSMANWGAVYLEYGWFGANSTYWGIDAGFGYGDPKGGKGDALEVGGGLSCGYTLNLPEGLRVILGSSVGLWVSNYESYSQGIEVDVTAYDFVGPFVKVQWSFIEVMYRWLTGYTSSEVMGKKSGESSTGNHQLMVGFCLGNSMTEYGGYSVARRFGTMGLNLVFPGLGSATVMKDWLGWGVACGSTVGGLVMMVAGEVKYDAVNVNTGSTTHDWVGYTPLFYVGMGMLIGGELFNLAWPWIRSNPDAGVSSADRDGFKFAVLPKDGDVSYVGAYTKSF